MELLITIDKDYTNDFKSKLEKTVLFGYSPIQSCFKLTDLTPFQRSRKYPNLDNLVECVATIECGNFCDPYMVRKCIEDIEKLTQLCSLEVKI